MSSRTRETTQRRDERRRAAPATHPRRAVTVMSAKQSPLLLALALALAGCRTDAPTAMATVETLPGGGIHVVNHDPIEWRGFDGWHLVEERVITSAPDGA